MYNFSSIGSGVRELRSPQIPCFLIFAVLDVPSKTLTIMLNFYGSFFTLIFAVLLVGANFYMRPEYLTIAISNLNFNFPPLIVHR